MRNKKKIFCSVLLFMLCFSFKVCAQPKLDGLAAVERALMSVGEVIKSVVTTVNTASEEYLSILIGDPDKTNYEVFRALREKISDSINAGQELYSKGKELAESEDPLKDLYEAGLAEAKATHPESAKTLENQVAAVQAQIDARKAALQEELEGKMSSASANKQTLTVLYDQSDDPAERESLQFQIAEADTLYNQYQQDLDDLQKGVGAYLTKDNVYAELLGAKGILQNKLESTLAGLLEKAKGFAASFVKDLIHLSPEQKAELYTGIIDENFFPSDQELTQEAVSKIMKNRRENLKNDIVKSLAEVIKFRKMQSDEAELKDNVVEEAQMVAENIENADASISAQRLQAQLSIEVSKLLHRQILVEGDLLRLKTSERMFHQDYRFIGEGKDPTVINFDDYELTKEKVDDNTPR